MNKLLLTVSLVASFVVYGNQDLGNWNYEELSESLGYSSLQNNPELSENEKFYLGEYKTNTYKVINSSLRQGLSMNDGLKAYVTGIDDSILKSPLIPNDVILYRGITLDYRGGKPYLENEEFTDKAYISTSLNLLTAKNFAEEHTEKGSMVFLIYSDQQFNGTLMSEYEAEVLLKRSSKFRIMKLEKKRGVYYGLTQLCDQDCNEKISPFAQEQWAAFNK